MGRTNPTYRDALRALEDRWGAYRRALRRRDQPRFDRLFEYAREHADAAGLLNGADPVVPALFGVALEQERRLDALEDRVAALEDEEAVPGPQRRPDDPAADGDGGRGRDA